MCEDFKTDLICSSLQQSTLYIEITQVTSEIMQTHQPSKGS